MKVYFGGIVTKASGKFVNMVFSTWRNLAYVRKFTMPTAERTPRQDAVVAVFSAIATYWANTLTEGLRQAWMNFAFKFTDLWGEGVSATGLNIFEKFNFILRDDDIINGGIKPTAYQDTPPPPTIPPDVVGVVYNNPDGLPTITITKASQGVIAGQNPFLDVWFAGDVMSFSYGMGAGWLLSTSGMPQAVHPVKSDYRHLGYCSDSQSQLPAAGLVFKIFAGVNSEPFTTPRRLSFLVRRYNKHGHYSSTQKFDFIASPAV